MARTKTIVEVAGKRLELSNLDKVLYPQTGFTKGQVIDYYRRISPFLLPHLEGHPLTLKRYPHGVHESYFYEKRCPSFRPQWMEVKQTPTRSDKPLKFCVVNDEPGLVWVANLASLELHVLLSRKENMERPSWLVFDLDPGPPAGLLQCAEIGLAMRDMLGELGLESFPKSSGGNGLHLYVPLNSEATFGETKGFARAVAEVLERHHGDRVTSVMKKSERVGKVFVDWSQNDQHKTTVCAYSLRARPRPTVSAPLEWKEVERAVKRGDAGTLLIESDEMLKRVNKKGDLFENVLRMKQQLPELRD